MNILILGGGGREHAMAWAISRSTKLGKLYAAPGNPGIAELATCIDVNPCDSGEIIKIVLDKSIDIVVVGPEAPLVEGVADDLRSCCGVAVFGPGIAGAMLEGSKALSKDFMVRHSIPTSSFSVCTTVAECRSALETRLAPYVVKACGLAAGKGAFVLQDRDEAMMVCVSLLDDGFLGDAGDTVIIEDFVPGFEITALAVTDGKVIRLLPLSQDHKRAGDGDTGPNTGGMGAYSPPPWGTEYLRNRIMKEVLKPTLNGLKKDGIPYCGVIYAGLMMMPNGLMNVIEYNVRLGDPEAQVVLPVFGGDWLEVIEQCCNGTLDDMDWPETIGCATGVVLASENYPGTPVTGRTIAGALPFDSGNTMVFHAGTAVKDGDLVSSGGRVLTVVGRGDTIDEAKDRAYQRLDGISLEGSFFRYDIAHGAKEEPVWTRNQYPS